MSREQIAARIAPLIRQATLIELHPCADAEALPLAAPHFGGQPYAEPGQAWPLCSECGRPLTFVCQLPLPTGGLFAFFYCWECLPQGDEPEARGAWRVRTYPDPQEANAVRIEPPPADLREILPCTVTCRTALSLPDWDGISLWCPEAEALSAEANPEEPWQPYLDAVTALAGEPEQATMVGGYPQWLQGEATPRCPRCGLPMALLAQIDSERAAGIAWGDGGLVYLFSCPEHPDERGLVLQSC